LARERVYKNNFLTQVIIRADFDAPLESLRETLPVGFKEAFAGDFPLTEERDGQTQEVTLRVHERSHEFSQRVSESFKTWRLLTADGSSTLEVSKDYVSRTVSSYLKFDQFAVPFFRAAERIAAAQDSEVSYRRLGLRYIDEITPKEDDPLDWSGLIVRKLTGALEFVKEDPLVRAMSVIEVERDNCRVRMQYGMPNPDYPARVAQKLFLLDTDAYISALITQDELERKAAELCKVANVYFERAIGSRLRALMGPEVSG
jgi:uncharacterized protein (TIGR04255 family)